MERRKEPDLSRGPDSVQFLLHHPDVRAELLLLIRQALTVERDLATFWHRYNRLWAEVPAGVLANEDEEFFDEVNERLHYTDTQSPADPTLSDPAAFTSWLAEAVLAFDRSAFKQFQIQNARARAARIAAAVLAGHLSPVAGAIDLNGLRASVDVPDNDPDFDAFMVIDSECDGLPLTSVRPEWSSEPPTREEPKAAGTEGWAMDSGAEAFRNVVKRFVSAA